MRQTDSAFEQAFADIAYSYLRDKAPKLFDTLVGFQVVDSDDDMTKAFGCFGFKDGEKWMYAPVFFINSQLKGSELLVTHKKMFVPMEENWVNFLLSRNTTAMGRGSSITEKEVSKYNPDLRIFSSSPLSETKSAYVMEGDRNAVYGKVVRGSPFDLRPVLTIMDNLLDSDVFTKVAAKFDLTNQLKLFGTDAEQIILAACARFTKLAEAVSDAYLAPSQTILTDESQQPVETEPDTNKLDQAISSAGMNRQMFNWYLREYVTNPLAQTRSEFRRTADILRTIGLSDVRDIRKNLALLLAPPATEGRKDIDELEVTEKAAMVNADGLILDLMSQDDRDFVFKHGFFVSDKRDDVSVVLDSSCSFTNPTGTSKAGVLMADGTFKDFTIIMPASQLGGESGSVLIPVKDSRTVYECDRSKLLVVEQDDLSGGVSFSDLSKDSVYFGMDSAGTATIPFRVTARDGDTVSVSRVYSTRVGPLRQRAYRGSGWFDSLYPTALVRCGASKFRVSGETVFTPRDAKFYKCWDEVKDEAIPAAGCCSDCIYTAPAFGTIDTLHNDLLKKSSIVPLAITKRAGRYEVKTFGVSATVDRDRELADLLLNSYSMPKDAVYDAFDKLDKSGSVSYLVKLAYGSYENTASFDAGAGVPVSEPEVYTEEIGMPSEDPAVNKLLNEAGRTGDKEVIDTAFFASLLKLKDVNSLVSKSLSDLTVGLDRIGRLLFAYYWKSEDFKDRYGTEELVELEDSLRNLFVTLGEVILFLKKKDVDYDIHVIGSDADLGNPD